MHPEKLRQRLDKMEEEISRILASRPREFTLGAYLRVRRDLDVMTIRDTWWCLIRVFMAQRGYPEEPDPQTIRKYLEDLRDDLLEPMPLEGSSPRPVEERPWWPPEGPEDKPPWERVGPE